MRSAYPRLNLNPALRTECRARRKVGLRLWKLALVAGLPHQSRLSSLLSADSVPATATTLRQLHRIADAVGFPKSQLFLGQEQEEAR